MKDREHMSRHQAGRVTALLSSVDRLGRPMVMGVLNVTPDSFSDGGRHMKQKQALAHAMDMIAEGADVIDVGGESTRPGAEPVAVEEELSRVLPVIQGIREISDIPISVDTWKSTVAREALAAGADIVNDISFGTMDDCMFSVVAEGGAGYVGMHMKGTPCSMQVNPKYGDVLEEVRTYLEKRAELAANTGVKREAILIDPGIGFGKTDAHNIALLWGIPSLCACGYRVAIGTSRKSMFGRLLKLDVADRLIPSVTSAVLAWQRGASLVRVHDVRETVIALETARLLCE